MTVTAVCRAGQAIPLPTLDLTADHNYFFIQLVVEYDDVTSTGLNRGILLSSNFIKPTVIHTIPGHMTAPDFFKFLLLVCFNQS